MLHKGKNLTPEQRAENLAYRQRLIDQSKADGYLKRFQLHAEAQAIAKSISQHPTRRTKR